MADRLKIAAITTIYHKYSHTQHIVDRFLEGYGWNGRHHRPEMDVVSLYVDQVKPRPSEGADESSIHYDLSEERAERFPQMEIYPTVADALTLGTGDLQVDGVLLVAEHGTYRSNEKGQYLYPRYELFKQIVSVYRTTGKTAPIFNGKKGDKKVANNLKIATSLLIRKYKFGLWTFTAIKLLFFVFAL